MNSHKCTYQSLHVAGSLHRRLFPMVVELVYTSLSHPEEMCTRTARLGAHRRAL